MKKNAFTNFINDYKIFIKSVKESDNKIKMVIPNLLTFSRILAPFFILPATLFGSFHLALSFAIAFALTDTFDGFLARKWNATSEFGKNLDPICDKFFVLGIVIPFLNNPAMIITLILEGIIAGINLKSAFKNNNPKSTYLGKGKTVLLSTLIASSYLFKTLGIPLDLLLSLFISTNIVQTITAINYLHIDNKKDNIKNIEETIKKEKTIEEPQIEKSKTHQELIEYKHIRESLILEKNKETENLEDTKRRHLNL